MKKLLIFLCAFFLLLPNLTAFSAVYTVTEEDTLWTIAKKYGVSLEELIYLNPQLANPDNIWAGLTINVPDTAEMPGDVPATTPIPGAKKRESLTFLYAGTPATYVKIIDTTNNSLKTISPDYFDIDSFGNLLITPSDKIDADFISDMQQRGIRVTPFISNHWDKPKGNAALDNAETLSTQLAGMIEKYNLDGVNIDIENVNETYRQKYTEFTRLVRSKLPANKLVTVSVAANPKGWTDGWHGSYDYNQLSFYTDYLMIMDYDESYAGGPAGPISSKDFFNGAIQYAFDQGVPKNKIVVGIPFFGRYWKEGDAVGGSAITAGDVEFLLTHYQSEKFYDEARQSTNVRVTIKPGEPEPKIWGGQILTAGNYNIWYDDLRAVKYKLGQINHYDLLGAGSWALGQENTETWRFYVDALNGNLPDPEPTPSPTPVPTPSPTPRPTPVPTPMTTPTPKPLTTLEKILSILNNSGTRKVTSLSTLTRGETAVLLSELTYLSPEPESASFADTANYWGKGQINALYRRGILYDEYNGNQFYPNSSIRRDDLAIFLERILVLPNTIDFHAFKFKDVPLASYGYNAVSKLCYFDIMAGFNKNFFRPEGSVTVGELASILDIIGSKKYPLNPDQHLENMPETRSKSFAPPNPDHEPVIEPK